MTFLKNKIPQRQNSADFGLCAEFSKEDDSDNTLGKVFESFVSLFFGS
jgi:hypothetical protein